MFSYLKTAYLLLISMCMLFLETTTLLGLQHLFSSDTHQSLLEALKFLFHTTELEYICSPSADLFAVFRFIWLCLGVVMQHSLLAVRPKAAEGSPLSGAFSCWLSSCPHGAGCSQSVFHNTALRTVDLISELC